MQITECFERFYSCLVYYFWGKKIKICVAGVSRSGKTSFCRAMIQERVLKKEKPTLGIQLRRFVKQGVHGVFYDIGGGEQYQNLVDFHYRLADAFFFVIDSSDSETWSRAKERLNGILSRNKHVRIPILVLCTHNDVDGFGTCQDIALDIGLDSLLGRDIACYSISSQTMSNFAAVEEWIVKHAK
ncbi:ADP-ribosylation factor-like protein 8 [Nematocida homosporus]|uniref:ADP-ribosylation factor-like protein 8 n=1 Tax=Nematocida homosporus TaxID=1912981 RepID=UPI00221F8B30|nr:ADP-ribosylation factor-like protein 8 [Nematocida homosporus]KAI5185239.1 ADP-ribosylation factor-like protein 8 [Nematocida homosporus]